ncbi:hypothetical protein MHY20_09825 [Helcobacillus sp. ACRRO]|uniref:hypothetical protein n=1 Tax=Helcobacillus sp. ACRRO TaxID=2918202 RepID=UPI001EF4CF78|nr:hypothetical protein [Helcobacillus sp. ACRRO]MCG7427900.1 hypothetical protein [Helcobacillus sp. ACRRO]
MVEAADLHHCVRDESELMEPFEDAGIAVIDASHPDGHWRGEAAEWTVIDPRDVPLLVRDGVPIRVCVRRSRGEVHPFGQLVVESRAESCGFLADVRPRPGEHFVEERARNALLTDRDDRNPASRTGEGDGAVALVGYQTCRGEGLDGLGDGRW